MRQLNLDADEAAQLFDLLQREQSTCRDQGIEFDPSLQSIYDQLHEMLFS